MADQRDDVQQAQAGNAQRSDPQDGQPAAAGTVGAAGSAGAEVDQAQVAEPTEAELKAKAEAEERVAMLKDADEQSQDPHFDATIKAWYRRNIEWVIRERDLHTQGNGADKRVELNP